MLVYWNAFSYSWVYFLLKAEKIWKSHPAHQKFRKQPGSWFIIIFFLYRKYWSKLIKNDKTWTKRRDPTYKIVLRLACRIDSASKASGRGSTWPRDPTWALTYSSWWALMYPSRPSPLPFQPIYSSVPWGGFRASFWCYNRQKYLLIT